MISNTSAEHYAWGSGCDGWHLVKNDRMSVIHEKMPPGGVERRHYHAVSRQFFFVLNGQLTMEFDDRRETLHPHQGIEIAPRVPHQAVNDSPQDVEFLVFSVPPGREDRVYV